MANQIHSTDFSIIQTICNLSNQNGSEWKEKEEAERILTLFDLAIEWLDEDSGILNPHAHFKFKKALERIRAKIRYSSEQDPVYKIWNRLFDLEDRMNSKPAMDAKLGCSFLRTLSEKEFRNYYSTYSNREHVLNILVLLKSAGIDPEIIRTTEERIDQLEKPMKQSDLKRLIGDLNPRVKSNLTHVSFRDLLKKHGFSATLQNIDFSSEGIAKIYWGTGRSTTILQLIDFEGITFDNCSFEWVNLRGCRFDQCLFKRCSMARAVLEKDVLFHNIRFEQTDLSKTFLTHSQFNQCYFKACNFNYATFDGTKLENVIWKGCSLEGTSFLQAEIKEGCAVFSGPSVKGCILGDNRSKLHFPETDVDPHEKPRIGFWWHLASPSPTSRKVEEGIIQTDCAPVKRSDQPLQIKPEVLQKELEALFQKVNSGDPIAQKVIRFIREDQSNSFPECHKAARLAKEMIRDVDCFLIPGGRDIEREFYDLRYRTQSADYRGTLLELNSLYFAREKGIPVVGICRGCQMGAVYHGGELIPHIEGNMGELQTYGSTPSSKHGEGVIRTMMGNGVTGFSFHHQAVEPKNIGKNLEIVAERQGVVKGMEGTFGAPQYFIQWHPEVQSDPVGFVETLLSRTVCSKANSRMLEIFFQTGAQTQRKKNLMEQIRKGGAA